MSQVWLDKSQWKGWLVAVAQTTPDSFPLLLQLPPAVLGEALKEPRVAQLRPQLAAYAASPTCSVAVPRDSLQLINA